MIELGRISEGFIEAIVSNTQGTFPKPAGSMSAAKSIDPQILYLSAKFESRENPTLCEF